jgi:hypothetical protein
MNVAPAIAPAAIRSGERAWIEMWPVTAGQVSSSKPSQTADELATDHLPDAIVSARRKWRSVKFPMPAAQLRGTVNS